jgi:hypothetical protein
LYELWVVSRARTTVVSDHYFTRDDLVSRLGYTAPGDLRWRPADMPEIPTDRIGHGFVLGVTVAADKVIDHDSVTDHLANGLTCLPSDKAALKRAASQLIGSWSDPVVSVTLADDGRLAMSGTPDEGHPLFVRAPRPDSWSFGEWYLHLLHKSAGHGIRQVVLFVSDRELHIGQPSWGRQRNLIAHVLTRVA